LLERQEPGFKDDKVYIPGLFPSQAEIDQSPVTSRRLKNFAALSPQLSADMLVRDNLYNNGRFTHFDQIGGTDVTQRHLIDDLAKDDQTRLTQLWANKGTADPQAVVDQANSILAGPDGRRGLVRKYVGNALNEIYEPDGSLTTDPELLYGARKNLNDYLSKEAGSDDPLSVRARASLLQLRGSLDNVIEQAAPGFKDYLANHAQKQGVIDANQTLIDARPSLAGTDGMMLASNVQRFMKKVVDERGSLGPNAYKNLSPDQMDQLWALRDDLRRWQGAKNAQRAPGSDTVQNAIDLARSSALPTMGGVVGGTLGSILGPVGTTVGSMTGVGLMKQLNDRMVAARALKQGHELLYPGGLLTPSGQ
jgi:hypothetical protein